MDNSIKHEKKQTMGYRQREFSAYIQPSDRSDWPLFQLISGFDDPYKFLDSVRRADNERVMHPKFNHQPYWIRREPAEYGKMTEKQKNTKSILYKTGKEMK